MTAHSENAPRPLSPEAQRRQDEYIARVVAEAPPLTNAQKDKLALLLRREEGKKK